MKFYKFVGITYGNFINGKVYSEDSRGENDNSSLTVKSWVSDDMNKNYELFSETDFKIGQQVICKDPTGYLVGGELYTILSIQLDENNDIGIEVEEAANKKGFNCGYNINRFTKFNYTITLDAKDLYLLNIALDIVRDVNVLEKDIDELSSKITSQLVSEVQSKLKNK